MTESEIIPRETAAELEQIGHADLVLFLPSCGDACGLEAAAAKARQILPMFSSEFSAVLVHSGFATEGTQPGETRTPPDGRLRLLEFPQLSESDPLKPAGRSLSERRRALFAISRMLTARVCTVVEADLQNTAAEGLFGLVQPVVDRNQDLMVAAYQRRRFDSLINIAIVCPLLRALYGRQVRWPLARDFSVSPRLVERYFTLLTPGLGRAEEMSPAWLVTEAVSGGFQVSQAYLQTRPETAKTGTDVSTILAQLLGPLFLAMEQDAPFWQKLRGSQPIPTFGSPGAIAEDPHPVDVGRMVESFRLGFQNLREIWSLVLSPASILELKKLTMMAPERFRLPDVLWARIVYDFALAFHLRIINRDHLLRALTPAYLAWVASYALEVKDAGEVAVAERIDRLCDVYSAEKPYFLSRWRWPDRFNP